MAAPRKPRAKKIVINESAQWEAILRSVTKSDVPVEFLKSITVNLEDRTKVHIDIRELLEDGHDPHDIEERINERLESLGDYIENVDLYICIDTVAKVVGPVARRILKNM